MSYSGGDGLMIHQSADISLCGKYRYRLDRWWDGPTASFGRLGILMLNPSTASATEDDGTIRKCIGFAEKWGYCGITVVNLYAFRSRDPSRLVDERGNTCCDIVGPRNLEIIHAVGRDVDAILCAWGCESTTRKLSGHAYHAEQCVRYFAAARGLGPMQLGPPTKTGEPRHPLRAPYSSPRIPFEVRV